MKKPDGPDFSATKPQQSKAIRTSRRRLVQALAAGGVITSAKLVPSEWSRPVVESVTLPAHAQTTGEQPICVLGNNENFLSRILVNSNRDESRLAGGIERILNGAIDAVIDEAHALDDDTEDFPDDSRVFCPPTGCAHIRYRCGDSSGKLFIGIIDLNADGFVAMEISVNFKDGQEKSLVGTCLGSGFSVRVNLINDSLAELIVRFNGEPFAEVDLVKSFACEPTEDAFLDDN